MDASHGLVRQDLDFVEETFIFDLDILGSACEAGDPYPAPDSVLPANNRPLDQSVVADFGA